ncbi:hypothetical protein HY643_04655 [Candidatus Woesearchaeota archaeon]|nr:hypothetical protein [Candidatus Woesearchaeota archaeon]
MSLLDEAENCVAEITKSETTAIGWRMAHCTIRSPDKRLLEKLSAGDIFNFYKKI